MNFLFDLYGTLLDIKTDEGCLELWKAVAALLGDPQEDYLKIKTEYQAHCNMLASIHGDQYAEINLLRVFEAMLAGRNQDTAGAPALARSFRLASREKLRPFPNVKEMLTELRENGAGVYLVSNAQACFTLDELEECGLTELFDGILISSEAGVKKPSEKIFEMAFEGFGIEREDCVYVGNDLRDDVLGAHNAGLKCVYIETEQSGTYDFDLPAPDYVVSSHREMKELLLSMHR